MNMTEQTGYIDQDANDVNGPAHVLDTVARVNRDQDMNRLKSATSLINTFNYAIQVQAGRDLWNEQDTRAFFVAYQAMDQIGATAKTTQNLKEVEKDIRDYVGDGQTLRENTQTQGTQLQSNIVRERPSPPIRPWPDRPDQTTKGNIR